MDLNAYSIPNGWNPPLSALESTNDGNTSTNTNISSCIQLGKRLMTLVRTVEHDSQDSSSHEDLQRLLAGMMELFTRKGLLQGNLEKAQKVLASRSQPTSLAKNKKSNKKKRDCGDDLRIMTSQESANALDSNFSSSDGTITDDEQLILAGLCRLLGGTQDLGSPRTLETNTDLVSIRLAAGTCLAITQRVQLFISEISDSNSCALAEHDLLATYGRTFLTGFARTIKALMLTTTSSSSTTTTISTLKVLLSSATLLISLFGTKLSRSSPVIEALRSVGWEAILHKNDSVQRGAAQLLASLTMTGVESALPVGAWTRASIDGIAAVSRLIKAVAPLKSKTSNNSDEKILSGKMNIIICQWIDHTRESLPDEALKVVHFRTCVSALIQYIVALFRRDFVNAQSNPALNASLLPMDDLLELLELLLSFPSSAESAYYGTKKRLRLETIQDGLLSPYAIATDVANFVKAMGQTLFQVVLDSIARPSLLQYGRRLTTLVHASLQTSCSTALRKAIDPTSSIRLDGKRGRWLHQSIALRTKTVLNAKSIILALGSNMVIESSNNAYSRGNRNAALGSKIILLIAGCAIEQIGWDGKDGDWGTQGERVDLAATAIDTLAATLDSCGGFLPLKTRALLDSTALTCLTEYLGTTSSRDKISTWSQTKVATLNLGLACICAPWQDSAKSELTTALREAAHVMVHANSRCVSERALHCLQVCNMQCTARAPPLSIVTRSTPGGASERASEIESASTIIDRLDMATTEINNNAVEQSKPKRKVKEMKVESTQKKAKPHDSSTFSDSGTTLVITEIEVTELEKHPVTFEEPQRLAELVVVESADDDEVMNMEPGSGDGGYWKENAIDDDEGEDGMPAIVDCGPDGDDED